MDRDYHKIHTAKVASKCLECFVATLRHYTKSYHWNLHAVESTVADELIKRLKFADVDENAEFTTTIRACLYYHPQSFEELR